MYVNKVKKALLEGGKAFGLILSWPQPQTVEIVGKLGMDYIQIDGEHGAFTLREIEETCRAAELHGMTVIARIPNIQSSTINQFLDRGVQGVIAPHISTRADAEQVVKSVYFGPKGDRSFGSARGVDFALTKKDRPAYFAESNRQMLVGVMLEDRASIDNLDEIMAVPGIDFLYIGMNDFAQGLGFPGEADHPEVLRHRDETFARVHAAGHKMREDFVVELGSKEMVISGTKKVFEKKAQYVASKSSGEK
jgi:2-keto-3-deoxy-L-rhamnonate aldolase RhmA